MNEMSYQQAMEELEQIVLAMETGDIPVDELSKKVKRASELIKVCKTVLYETTEDVNKVLKEMEGISKSEKE
ncbi:MAG: exodeoxyribonuclease VII small subunit [Bacteroidales bacterium]|nr:exodeoxyribonuclease VII small subunit [Bacteroidales bacterium]